MNVITIIIRNSQVSLVQLRRLILRSESGNNIFQGRFILDESDDYNAK